MMTEKQKEIINRLRGEGVGYGKISELTGINRNTIKSYCKRHGVSKIRRPELPDGMSYCENCASVIVQEPKRKRKRFCCDECRQIWWKNHPERINRKAVYDYTCPECGKTFQAYGNANRKYCSHGCYIKHRFESEVSGA